MSWALQQDPPAAVIPRSTNPAHIERRCQAERWENDYNKGVALTPEKVALYDADKYVIRPFTVARKCAFVEMVAVGPQPPLWFVSHWW